MEIRGHGSAVAVVLSVLALAVAGGGTAVAVSSSVNIADPKTPSRIAKVDAGGRLTVAGAASTINAAGYVYGYTDMKVSFVTSPTTATLGFSRIWLSNPAANGTATEQQLQLGRYGVTAGGECDVASVPTLLNRYDLAPGDQVVDVLPAPLLVAAAGTAKYCLGFKTVYLGAADATPSYYLSYALTGYLVAGAYTGVGINTPAAQQPRSAKIGG